MADNNTNIQAFLACQAGIGLDFNPTNLGGKSIWRWEGSSQQVPIRLRSGPKTCGAPFEKKWFSSVELNGDAGGSFVCRVWVDGHLVVAGASGSFAEIPGRPWTVRMPRGTKGYDIDIEMVYVGRFRGAEVNYDLVERKGGQH